MHDKKYFCYEIYKNLAVWSYNGKIGYNPCSYFNGYIKESDQLVLDEIWQQSEHRTLMLKVEQDEPIKGCETCYYAEQHGLESRRCGSRKLYEEYHNDQNIDLQGPQGLDYSVGNLCNLKCVICGPGNSSAWIPDYQRIWPEKIEPWMMYDKRHQVRVERPEFLANLKNIHFHGGGEPFLSDNHIDLLKKVKEVKGLSDVRVFYNTNGTVRVPDSVLKLWEECKLVELYFSIDDVGQRFEYQRTNANWQDVVSNMQWYKENMPHNHMFNINCTWSYLNVFYLNELADWHRENFSANRYGDPCELLYQKVVGPFELREISPQAHQLLMQKFKGYPGLQNLINTLVVKESPSHEKFWKHIDKIDQVRGNDFRSLCPEWSALL